MKNDSICIYLGFLSGDSVILEVNLPMPQVENHLALLAMMQ